MAVFAIILNDPDDRAWDAIKDRWPKRHYFLNDRVAFISGEDILLTSDIASDVGMNNDHKIRGIVLEADNRGGWNDSSLVEWLGKFS